MPVSFGLTMPPGEDASISLHRHVGSITGPCFLRDSQRLDPLNASVWMGPNGSHDEQISIVERDAMAIREASYLGLRTSDYEAMGMDEWACIDLSESDPKQLDRLSSCEWLKSSKDWQEEFRTMKRRGFKIEMEATYSLSRSYLAETYLPERIAAGDHLRPP